MTAALTSTTRVSLTDGSVCVIEPTGARSSLISRLVDGECVWGQAFSSEAHEEQVARVVDAMVRRPEDYRRWNA